jgi:hypothetical protein
MFVAAASCKICWKIWKQSHGECTVSDLVETFSGRNALVCSDAARWRASESSEGTNVQKVCCIRVHFSCAVPSVRMGIARSECHVQNVFAIPVPTTLVQKQTNLAPGAFPARRRFRRRLPIPENSTPRPVLHVIARQTHLWGIYESVLCNDSAVFGSPRRL